MSGIFHSLKKTLSTGDNRPDLEFLDAKARFEVYSDTCIKLKGNFANYLSHANAIYVCSNQISLDFGTLMDDPDKREADYSKTSQSMRLEHALLSADHVPKQTGAFQTQILSLIDAEIASNAELSRRIARRMELFGECGYYQKKVNELRDEKEKRAGKGKPESASDAEKYERNTKKLDEVRISYNELHTKLMKDLNKLHTEDRTKHIGPMMMNFLTIEKRVASTYTAALDKINMETTTAEEQ
jgi:hypothetical protein